MSDTVAIREPLAQPTTLPLLASLAVRAQLALRYGVDCRIKLPNDLLLNGKKIVGILCEGVSYGYQQQGRGILCGIGINLAQPQSYFDAADLPNGTSLALQGANGDLATDPAWLAEGLTDFGFDRNLYAFARDGFAPFREEYKAACVNLGRRVTFDLPDGGQGAGEAVDVDEEGRLVVRTDSGEVHVFTGEVSVHGIYGAVFFSCRTVLHVRTVLDYMEFFRTLLPKFPAKCLNKRIFCKFLVYISSCQFSHTLV